MFKKISWKFWTVFGCLKAFPLASVEAVEAAAVATDARERPHYGRVPNFFHKLYAKAPSMSFYPDFIPILSWFYPDFILIFEKKSG